MDDDFQSLNKGVFVVPFDPSSAGASSFVTKLTVEAGPSRRRPLKRVYDQTYAHYVEAYSAWEKDRVDTQLDDISEWIEGLHVAVMQDLSTAVPLELATICTRAHTIHAKDAMDLAAGSRNIALGFIGEEGLGKRSAKSGVDRVEEWYLKQKDRSPLLLHIQQAQLIAPAVLSELIYILAIHPSVPFRLLLSVASTSLFLSSWTHIEPSLIDLHVIAPSRTRRRVTAVDAILDAAMDSRQFGLSITEDLADELREMQALTGGGPAALLKALRWVLLHHSYNTPLSFLQEEDTEPLHAIVQALRDGKEDFPGRELLRIDTHPGITAALDPAPRISILHALAHPEAFVSPEKSALPSTTPNAPQPRARKTSGRKRTQDRSPSPASMGTPPGTSSDRKEGGDLGELRMLFELWKAAGRNVSLWDWFEGFRGAVQDATAGSVDTAEAEADEGGQAKKARITTGDAPEEHDDNEEEGTDVQPVMDPEMEDRLHAAFIRFCEEARMLGLVRARGGKTAKRADEVVKGIGLV